MSDLGTHKQSPRCYATLGHAYTPICVIPYAKGVRNKGTKNALDAQYQPRCPLKLLLLTLACYPLLPCEEPTNTYYIIMYKDEL